MNGLMMDFPLTLNAIFRRAEQLFGPRPIVFGATKPLAADYIDYEKLIAGAEPLPDRPDPGENTAAAMCYTTGTTGNPKGVLYSHRAIVLHTLGLALDHCMGIRETDVMLP